MKYTQWYRYLYKSNQFLSSLSLSAVVVLLLITTACGYYDHDRVRCLSTVHFPAHGSISFKGHFAINLYCPNDDEDIPANAPGIPPGILYCKQDYPNKELAALTMPECIKMKQPNPPKIQMLVILTYDGNVQSEGVCQKAFNKFNTGNISSTIKEMCPCMFTQPTQGLCKFGVLMDYDKEKTIEHYDSIWVKITTIVEDNADELKLPRCKLEHIDYTPWAAACDSIPNSVPTILSLHEVVSCRGCSESHYVDAHLGDRCLQCPFGYWTKNSGSDADSHFNSHRDCTKCTNPSSLYNRREFLQLCYYRL